MLWSNSVHKTYLLTLQSHRGLCADTFDRYAKFTHENTLKEHWVQKVHRGVKRYEKIRARESIIKHICILSARRRKRKIWKNAHLKQNENIRDTVNFCHNWHVNVYMRLFRIRFKCNGNEECGGKYLFSLKINKHGCRNDTQIVKNKQCI